MPWGQGKEARHSIQSSKLSYGTKNIRLIHKTMPWHRTLAHNGFLKDCSIIIFLSQITPQEFATIYNHLPIS